MKTCVAVWCLLAASVVVGAQSTATQPTNSTPVWQMEASGTKAGLRGIDSVDGQVAWASGTEGTVLRTVDGGAHWTKCAVPDGDKDGATLDLRGVQAWDEKAAIVMASGPGEKSRLFKTTDGCKTWVELFRNPDKDGFWDAISVTDQTNIKILGDPVSGRFTVFSTSDGGKTWERDKNVGLTSAQKEGGFAASNSSMMIDWIDGPTAFVTGGPSGARVFIECDMCKSDRRWKVLELVSFSHSESAGAFALAKRDWKTWIAVGGDYEKARETAGTVASTLDSGRTWTASRTPPHGYRSTVQWGESVHAWITAGTNGSDISRDDGKTWQPLDDGNWNALSLPFIVGPQGRIARLNAAALPAAK